MYAVVNGDDRSARHERRQHVMRGVKERDALAAQRETLRRDPLQLGAVALLALQVFQHWKHGFVRRDAHPEVFFAFLALAPAAIAIALESPRAAFSRLALLASSLALAGESDADPADNTASLELTVAAAPAETACVVPRLRGTPLLQARRSITASGCRIGAISTRRDTRVRRGLVLASRPVAGARLARGSRIAVVVSSGPR